MPNFHLRAVSVAIASVALSSSAGVLAQTASAPSTSMAASSGARSGPVSADDRGFVAKAAAGGMAEVAAGELAQQKSATDSVKSYGKHLVDDHSKANNELKQIAGGKGLDVPAAPDAADKAAMARMQAMSAAQFDSAFKAQMIADHQKTIALFKHEAAVGKDADLKAFAAKTLPDLQDHLKMAQALK